MKKWILTIAAVMGWATVSFASLLIISGTIEEGTGVFTYDGKTFQDGWAIRMYQSPSATVNFSPAILNNHLAETTIVVYTNPDWPPIPPPSYVAIYSKDLSFPDNIFIYSVLFDTALPTSSGGHYLLLDTVARNVGAYNPPNPPEPYTPSHNIPYAGWVQFEGQTWQPIPEPATLGLLGLGTLALALRRRFLR